MLASFHAETLKLVKRPAAWLLLAVALFLSLLFTYLIPYAGYAGGTSGPTADRGLAAMLPDQLVGNSIGGLPVFLGALIVILAVLVVGGEYNWGTWKTILTQGPSRLSVYTGKLLVLAAATAVIVLTMFAGGAISSAIIAAVENAPLDWPSWRDLLIGFGAGWLIAAMWAAFGVLLAVLFRGVSLPIGLGLVWLLAVQNLLTLIAAPLIDWVAELQKGLPGPNAGSLTAVLGSNPEAPGVATLVSGGQSAWVIAAYVVGFCVLAGAVLRRRDIV